MHHPLADAWWDACRAATGKDRTATTAVFRSVPTDEVPAFVTAVCARCFDTPDDGLWRVHEQLKGLATAFARAPGAWSESDARNLIAMVLRPGRQGPGSWWVLGSIHRIAVTAVTASAAVPDHERRALALAIERAGYPAGETSTLLQRLVTAGGEGPPGPSVALGSEDIWTSTVRSTITDPPDGLVDLVAHLAKAGPQPTATWRRGLLELVAGEPALADVVHDMLAVVPPLHDEAQEGEETDRRLFGFFYGPNAETLRGAIRARALLPDAAEHVGLLTDLVVIGGSFPGRSSGEAPCEKVAAAAAAALGDVGTADAAAALTGLDRRIRNRNVRKAIQRAKDDLALAAGITPEEMAEAAVPAIDPTAKGKPVRVAVADERFRIESLLAVDRTWDPSTWVQRYRHHPLTGSFGPKLLWEFELDGSWIAAWPGEDPGLAASLDGTTVRVADASRVRLWHPEGHTAPEIGAWRAWCVQRSIVQPFKQVFREHYVLTPAEEETRAHSLRFSGQVLRAPVLAALLRERRWGGKFLGGWHGGTEATATRELPGGLRACLYYEADREHIGIDRVAAFAITGRIWFDRRSGRSWSPLTLTEVPPRVFSEAMRDVDLFVGVASIGADPLEGMRAVPHPRWRPAAFDDLTESGRSRRDALERLLPSLRIADRCSLEDRWLVVRGDLASYRIHLGSASVLMQPDDRYLCIVPKSSPSKRIYLPFEEGGGMLSVIISKALLLAADRKITDPNILGQIDPERFHA